MRWSRLNFILLVVNMGLMVAIAGYVYTRTAPEPVQVQEPVPEPTPEPQILEKVVKETVTVTNQASWRQLESEDYREYISRLRSIGCPEQTIRDIIIADLDKLYAPKLQSLQGRRSELNYWNSEEEELANEINPVAQKAKQRAIDDEKRKVIEELLGIDLVRERLKQRGQEDYYERRLAFLPEQKRDIVRRLMETYDQQEQAIRSKQVETGEPMTAEDQVELRQLAEERQAKLAGTLSEKEVAQMELWTSPTANSVRHDLYGMNASEEEFQAVFQARKAFDQKWAQTNPALLDESTRTQYEQAKAAVESQLKEQLGEQRYAAYQRGADEDYHRLTRLATRFNLPQQASQQAYELKRTLQSMSEMVKKDPSLSPEQKDQALKAMSSETEREMKALLGEKAYKFMVGKGEASWLSK